MAKKITRGVATCFARMIEHRIYLIRGHKVVLDSDLANPYQAPIRVFNQTVKCNTAASLRILCSGTEQGVAGVAVLHCKRAVQTGIVIVRVFVQHLCSLTTHEELARKMEESAMLQVE